MLITSKESANVTIGNVKEAQLSMMMGDGEDKVTISNDLILFWSKNRIGLVRYSYTMMSMHDKV
ncbi:hypothetical protein INT80_12420 [Gallibacterium anatis]|uniref:Uncharacterized protein n=1 Tax=Gallibacterium anatis TaxID=750 RepID=A0A930US43_9PAST|nr:hypothetical protein [Gallibacterium anatis]